MPIKIERIDTVTGEKYSIEWQNFCNLSWQSFKNFEKNDLFDKKNAHVTLI